MGRWSTRGCTRDTTTYIFFLNFENFEERKKWILSYLAGPDAAKEAAAKLNALLASKGLAPQLPQQFQPQPPQQSEHQGEYAEEIEINDSIHRVHLSKKYIQEMVNIIFYIKDQTKKHISNQKKKKKLSKDTGATIETKGVHIPNKSVNTTGERPLYLRITGPTQEIVNFTAKKIKETLEQTPRTTETPTVFFSSFFFPFFSKLSSNNYYFKKREFYKKKFIFQLKHIQCFH